MPNVHPTALVSPQAVLAEDAEVGPWCVLLGRVVLGAGVRLHGNNYVQGTGGPVEIGAGTQVYPFACIGYEPQDYKFKPGSPTAGVRIGKECLIREHATVHAASNTEHPTTLGDRVFLMVSTHVAHDCMIGDRVVMVNGAGIAGHGRIESDVTLGGNAVIHQHCRLGRLVMMSGDCAVSLDVPPFCTVNERNRIGGLNLVGLRRSGMPAAQIGALRVAFRDLLRNPMPRSEVVRELRERAAADGASAPALTELADFIEASKRGITPGMGKPARGSVGAGAGVSGEGEM
ncbi:MAG: acyl-ACP--UDP-N-acetylglucosamine O-acyltransferase [Phycisphaeraceae bacterium]|nr:acyl-ACP--UDP-N-acetylglucosamine O-acyltransferase [Phycisphaeraceae bacterium]